MQCWHLTPLYNMFTTYCSFGNRHAQLKPLDIIVTSLIIKLLIFLFYTLLYSKLQTLSPCLCNQILSVILLQKKEENTKNKVKDELDFCHLFVLIYSRYHNIIVIVNPFCVRANWLKGGVAMGVAYCKKRPNS